ncbi:SDR family oxidoreductase [Parahaliea sp. F7430]|uniref:SDR family oxidoreductase n=1 Tax=Sediminihaliea albiluteola TaxID=2758564 RepID=A0A7W2TVM1_9GAMM|nr:SDR family oxidoreductase [Sediminihaliea albiluteola]MBA6412797.1 SDR family oxidoreductase [Sediminihaliea albiluteola]
MKTAIITGASVGIGQATAARFLADDYQVFNLARRACPEAGVNNLYCDLSSDASIAQACAKLAPVIEKSSSVALIHNASQMHKDSTDDCDSEDLRAVLEVNVVAINSLNRSLLGLLPKGSSVIYVGSTLSEKAVPGSFSYVLSKHAQLGMMRASCQDLMGRGIHTALVCPGFTDTEMLRTHLGNDLELINTIAAGNSFSRLIEPGEIAELLHWAHHNPVVNGAVLHANLGQREY